MKTLKEFAEDICKGSRLWDTLSVSERKACVEHTVRLLEESEVLVKE